MISKKKRENFKEQNSNALAGELRTVKFCPNEGIKKLNRFSELNLRIVNFFCVCKRNLVKYRQVKIKTMPVRRAEIETTMINPELGMGFAVPVFYTDELVETSVFDLAYSSVNGGFLPYLFAGYFTDGGKFHKWYFANARRHEEMRQAVEQELGRTLNYTYGQIWFNSSALREGELRFDRLILHGDLPNKKEAEKLLKSSIRPDYLEEDFEIAKARW